MAPNSRISRACERTCGEVEVEGKRTFCWRRVRFARERISLAVSSFFWSRLL